MKFDMSGAAAVLGTMHTLAQTKPAINVIGVMSCAMNMIGQTPFLPDSVYKSYKGLFVEIGHTDAEGRLVLADAIAYTIDKYQPAQVVDLATLTGACMVALGGAYAGLFSTSKSLANALHRAGEETGERLWHLPIDDCYAAKTQIADVNNDGSPYGGASTGAVFIKKFADKTPGPTSILLAPPTPRRALQASPKSLMVAPLALACASSTSGSRPTSTKPAQKNPKLPKPPQHQKAPAPVAAPANLLRKGPTH